jgi:hypothetical protein
MSELAAHLVDHVLPHVPIRQWVFTVPVPLRYQLVFDAGLTRAVLRVFLRTLFGWQRRQAARHGLVGARSGSVTAIQRRLATLVGPDDRTLWYPRCPRGLRPRGEPG